MRDGYLVIESHTHYLPPEALKVEVKNTFDVPALTHSDSRTPVGRTQDIEGLVRLMEDSGIDMAVLAMAQQSTLGFEVCKVMNERYAWVGKKYPGKFILCGHVPLQQGQEVLDEIDRCINGYGFKGIALTSSGPETALDSPALWPIYEKISRLNVPIVVHPPIRFPIWGGGKKYALGSTISREYDIALATVEILYAVLKDFPDLKFLIAHYGGGMPALKARVRAWFEPDNWSIPSDILHNPKTPRELDELGISQYFDNLFDKLYFDMAGSGAGWLPMIQAALATIRHDRMCFGSDYPFDIHNAADMRAFIDVIKKLNIPESDKRLILGENIKNLFKI